jgi:hypothetical protein
MVSVSSTEIAYTSALVEAIWRAAASRMRDKCHACPFLSKVIRATLRHVESLLTTSSIELPLSPAANSSDSFMRRKVLELIAAG